MIIERNVRHLRALCYVSMFAQLLVIRTAAADAPLQEAKALFEVGAQAYSAGDYPAAIEAFDEAYRRAARPGLVFSLAQAHRRAYQQSNLRTHLYAAIANYQKYLEQAPNGPRKLETIEALRLLDRESQKLDQTSSKSSESASPQARLMIACRAPGAVLSVDGNVAPRLPYVGSIAPGSHKLAIRAQGYAPYEQTIEAPPTGVVALNIDLQKLPAELTINGPQGAEVLVDGRFVGWLPMRELRISAGLHRVSVRKAGYQLVTRDIELEHGRKQTLNVELKSTTQRDISRVLIVGGLVGVTTAGALATVAFLHDNKASDIHDKWNKVGSISTSEQKEYESKRTARDDFRAASIMTGGASAAVALTGLILYVTDQPDRTEPIAPEKNPIPDTEPALDFALAPACGPSELGLNLRGSF